MTFASGVITVALRNNRYDVITIFVLLLHAIKRARKSFVLCGETTLQFDTLSHLVSCQKLFFHYRVYLSFFLFLLAIKREKRNTVFCRKPILQFNTLSYLLSCETLSSHLGIFVLFLLAVKGGGNILL